MNLVCSPVIVVLCLALFAAVCVSKSHPGARLGRVTSHAQRSALLQSLTYRYPNHFQPLNKRGEALDLQKKKARVSYQECNLDPGLRLDCGFYGITYDQCRQRGCCYGESEVTGVPWCYHSKPTLGARCSISGDEKIDCGSFGIRKHHCLAMGCCWQPNNNKGEPWCYHRQPVELPKPGECGVPSIPPRVRWSNSRIVGGKEALPHSWPWQVSLQIDGQHFCGASILNDRWVLSAAHCGEAFGYGTVTVVVGAHDYSRGGGEGRQEIAAEQHYMHEDYSAHQLNNDIMLIKLESKITFGETVEPICLPDPSADAPPGTKCYVTGWGTTMLHGESPQLLQQVMTPVLTRETCTAFYAEPENWYTDDLTTVPNITDQMICTGYEEGGRGGCHGDSGGPMVCFLNDEHWTLHGVVSWGGPCAYERTPSVFARVTRFIDWIQTNINKFDRK